jgi:type IV pilus assembly protein PilB
MVTQGVHERMVARLGELLLRANLITRHQLEQAIAQQKVEGGRLGAILIKHGLVREEDVSRCLGEHYGLPYVDLDTQTIAADVISLIHPGIAQKHLVIPVAKAGTTLTMAMADPTNVFAVDDIKFMTGLKVELLMATESAIRRAIDRYYDSSETLQNVMASIEDAGMEVMEEQEDGNSNIADLRQAVEEAPVVKLVNLILAEAIKRGASDIHAEPYERVFRVRFRIDGVLYEMMNPPMGLKNAIISRLKIMADLDISERRLPQDGRMKVKCKGREVDFRVSTLPTLFGEKVVMRLLDKSNLKLDLSTLGFAPKALSDFEEAICAPYGMILVTGPTGSGKTTTLYSVLDRLNQPETNIMTAEDPVEFNIKGINQVQIRENIGLTFASALRSFLRQDPDIIMVGEIRDYETAEIAVKAALTGHLVLSTLHTNDAPSAVTRLLNMGIEPFLVASSIVVILAQRLLRRICAHCKAPATVPAHALVDIGLNSEETTSVSCYKGHGCDVCHGTGYKGRIAIYEVMLLSAELRDMVLRSASALEIKRGAIQQGMRTLRMSGLDKLREGVTTVEEVVRVTFKD